MRLDLPAIMPFAQSYHFDAILPLVSAVQPSLRACQDGFAGIGSDEQGTANRANRQSHLCREHQSG
jgi:hypothetical protein